MSTTTTTSERYSTAPSYTAVFAREGRDWLVHLAEDDRIHSFGRTFSQARQAIREAAAVWFDVEADEVEIRVALPPSYQVALDELAEARARLEQAQADVRERSIDAARMLTNWCDASTRDIAEILGLSHQRVHQLLQER